MEQRLDEVMLLEYSYSSCMIMQLPRLLRNKKNAALITLKNWLTAEWVRYGIRTNSVSPGYMDTVLNEGPGIAEARDVWAARNPTGRMGTPEELTGAIVMSSAVTNSYINGTDIVVDGGAIVFQSWYEVSKSTLYQIFNAS
jgi:sorbose reductase